MQSTGNRELGERKMVAACHSLQTGNCIPRYRDLTISMYDEAMYVHVVYHNAIHCKGLLARI